MEIYETEDIEQLRFDLAEMKKAAEKMAAKTEAADEAAAENEAAAKSATNIMHAEVQNLRAELQQICAGQKAAAEKQAAEKEAAEKAAAEEQEAAEKEAGETALWMEQMSAAKAECDRNVERICAEVVTLRAENDKAAVEKMRAEVVNKCVARAAAEKAAVEKAAAEKAAAEKEAADKGAAEKAAAEKAAAEKAAAEKAAAEKAAAEKAAAEKAAAEKAAVEKAAAEKAAAEKEAADKEAADSALAKAASSGQAASSAGSQEFQGVADFTHGGSAWIIPGHSRGDQAVKGYATWMRVNTVCWNMHVAEALQRMYDGRGVPWLNKSPSPADNLTWAAVGWDTSTQKFYCCGDGPEFTGAYQIENAPHVIELAKTLLPSAMLMVQQANQTEDERSWHMCQALLTCCKMLAVGLFPPSVLCANMYVRDRNLQNLDEWPLPGDWLQVGHQDLLTAAQDFCDGLRIGLQRANIIAVQVAMPPRPAPPRVVSLQQNNWTLVNQHFEHVLADVLADKGVTKWKKYPEDPETALRATALLRLFLEAHIMKTLPLTIVHAHQQKFDVRSLVQHCSSPRSEAFKP